MFGQNPLRKKDHGNPDNLWIQEVFLTIQGEGPFAGQAAVFVRLGGCNLACYWCDTQFESSTWHPDLDELIRHIAELTAPLKDPLVVLTGGEPMRQNVSKLIQILLFMNVRVQIETNGILWIDEFDGEEFQDHFLTNDLSIVCSPKTGKLHKKILEHCIALKYIVSTHDADSTDGLPISSTQRQGRPLTIYRPDADWPGEIYVQPLDEQDDLKNKDHERLACDLVMEYGYRLSFQMHKHLGLP